LVERIGEQGHGCRADIDQGIDGARVVGVLRVAERAYQARDLLTRGSDVVARCSPHGWAWHIEALLQRAEALHNLADLRRGALVYCPLSGRCL
jgi:hypothetical protein